MAAGALCRSVKGAVLLVKPAYKNGWEIPGGVIEAGESPRSCCRRELLEELGCELTVGRLLVMDWLPPTADGSDGWMFIYDGGVVGDDLTSRIELPADELLEWRMVAIDEVDQYLPPAMVRRIRVAHDCALNGTTADLESGQGND